MTDEILNEYYRYPSYDGYCTDFDFNRLVKSFQIFLNELEINHKYKKSILDLLKPNILDKVEMPKGKLTCLSDKHIFGNSDLMLKVANDIDEILFLNDKWFFDNKLNMKKNIYIS